MELQAWTTSLTDSMTRVAARILDDLPTLLGALVLLLLGWAVAWLLRTLTFKLMQQAVSHLARSRPMDTRVQQPRAYGSAPKFAARLVFWLTLLFFVLAAAEVLQLAVISGVLAGMTAYVPRLVAGLLILFLGLWFAEVVRELLTRSAARMGIEHTSALGRLGQVLVLLIVFSVAAGQIGIDNSLLVALVTVLFAVGAGAVAIAFALGARSTVANLLAAQSIAQLYQPGDHLRIGDTQGKVIRITATGVILETRDGRTLVPARLFDEQTSTRLEGGPP